MANSLNPGEELKPEKLNYKAGLIIIFSEDN